MGGGETLLLTQISPGGDLVGGTQGALGLWMGQYTSRGERTQSHREEEEGERPPSRAFPWARGAANGGSPGLGQLTASRA